jgi:MtrB/PioB family decaheme-associated outer membrane protein
MSQLENSLQDLPLGIERNTYRFGANLYRGEWDWGADYRLIEHQGSKLQGASFLNTSSILPVALDRTTQQLDARLSHTREAWQIQATYHGSVFDNRIKSVTWDNPFTPLAEGGDRGRIAQEPGNRFDQLMLSGSWRPIPNLQTSGRLAVGRMEQNEAFLAPTINPIIEDIALPGSRLDGKVDTLNSQVRMVLRPAARLTLTGELYHDDRNNRTPREEYLQVRTDLAPGPARFNQPYSFERQGGKLRSDFKTTQRATLSAGASREEIERSFQETEKTSTTDYWGELRAAPVETLDLRLKIGQERRRFIDNYQPLGELTSDENPLLRKYHLGERDRDLARASVTYMPADRISLGLSVDYASDDYWNTRIGLTDARDFSQSLDISTTPTDRLTLYAFYSHQRIDFHQSGSESFAAADWTGRQQDTIHTLGLGFEIRELRAGLDLGLDYGYSFGRGEIDVQTRAANPGFPDLKSNLNSVKVFSRYRLSERLFLRLDYWYERYNSDDFFIDNVSPDTIATVLSAGQQSPDYSVHVAGVSMVYRF